MGDFAEELGATGACGEPEIPTREKLEHDLNEAINSCNARTAANIHLFKVLQETTAKLQAVQTELMKQKGKETMPRFKIEIIASGIVNAGLFDEACEICKRIEACILKEFGTMKDLETRIEEVEE